MYFIIRKSTKSGEMVRYLFIGTDGTTKACLLEPRHRTFTGCDADSDCVAKVIPFLLYAFAKQFFNP